MFENLQNVLCNSGTEVTNGSKRAQGGVKTRTGFRNVACGVGMSVIGYELYTPRRGDHCHKLQMKN